MDSRYSESEIKKLIERFMEGDTSLEEEHRLYYFFTREDVPDSLVEYKDMFADFAAIECGNDVSTVAETSVHEDGGLQCVQTNRPLHRISMGSFRKWAVAAAASIVVVLGTSLLYDHYEEEKLERRYGGSYMVVNGTRIDNLREMQPEIENVLAHADEIENRLMASERIRMAEQTVLNGIADEAERERIRRILDE